MAVKRNTKVGDYDYYRITRKVGRRKNKKGEWIPEYKQFYGKSKKEAEEKYKEYIDTNHDIDGKGFGELMERFIRNTFLPDPELSNNTKRLYINAYYDNMADTPIAKMCFADVTYDVLQKAYNRMTCGRSGIVSCNKLIKRFYMHMSLAHDAIDITKAVVVPKANKGSVNPTEVGRIEVWSDDELKKIVAALDGSRYRFLVILAINTGARIGELLALEYSDISIEDRKLFITKQLGENAEFEEGKTTHYPRIVKLPKSSNSIRSIPLNDTVMDALEVHKRWHEEEQRVKEYSSELVFTTVKGTYYDPSNIRKQCKKIYEKANVPNRRFHVYRKTFGSKLANKGVPIQVLSKILGHSSVNVTAKYYIHVTDDVQVDAVKLMDL